MGTDSEVFNFFKFWLHFWDSLKDGNVKNRIFSVELGLKLRLGLEFVLKFEAI